MGHFTAGGTERATFLLANQLVESYETYIISTHTNAPFFSLNERIRYDYLKEKSIVKRIIELTKFLKNKKIDVLISIEAMSGIYSIIATKLAGCKHIIWEHANFYQTQGSRYIHLVRRLELIFADYYIVLTKRDLRNFEENYYHRCPLDYVYNIVERIDDPSYDMKSRTIISVGVVRDIKNFAIIPEMAKEIFDRRPDWNWKIYGQKNSKYAQELEEKIKQLDLSDKVYLCGQTSDIDSVYRKAAIYVMTSKMEGLPMVLLEAKVHGIPMVSFDIETGPDEIISDNEDGYLVPYDDRKKMINKILYLIDHPDEREKMSSMCSENLECFSAQVVSEKWRKIMAGL